MNYFFGYKDESFSTQLSIPKFQNRSLPNTEIVLWSITSNGKLWEIHREEVQEDTHFFHVDSSRIDNKKVFVLASQNDVKAFDSNALKPLNGYTSTLPAYRSNFKLIHTLGGFSSYQSEYPSGMVGKKGGIISSIKSLLNPAADENYILIRNVYQSPQNATFNSYLIDYKTSEILAKYTLNTNETNCISIEKKHILPNVFLYTDGYLGIPVYVSQHKGYLSMEHTHPPHSYILSDNVFKKISELKKEFHAIVHS